MKNVNAIVLQADNDDSANGDQIDASQIYAASFQAINGDTGAAGTVKIQASNDLCPAGYLPDAFTVTNWVDIPSASVAVVAGAPVLISLPNVTYRWLRVVFTETSPGNTTITVQMYANCL